MGYSFVKDDSPYRGHLMVKKQRKSKKKPRKSIETHDTGKASTYDLYNGKTWYSGITRKGKHLVFTKSEIKRAKARGKKLFK